VHPARRLRRAKLCRIACSPVRSLFLVASEIQGPDVALSELPNMVGGSGRASALRLAAASARTMDRLAVSAPTELASRGLTAGGSARKGRWLGVGYHAGVLRELARDRRSVARRPVPERSVLCSL